MNYTGVGSLLLDAKDAIMNQIAEFGIDPRFLSNDWINMLMIETARRFKSEQEEIGRSAYETFVRWLKHRHQVPRYQHETCESCRFLGTEYVNDGEVTRLVDLYVCQKCFSDLHLNRQYIEIIARFGDDPSEYSVLPVTRVHDHRPMCMEAFRRHVQRRLSGRNRHQFSL